MTPDEIVATARECLGVPFRHQGRSLTNGVDCIGVVSHVAGKWFDVVEPPAYARMPSGGLLEYWINKNPCAHRVREMMRGDILVMRYKREPMHLAIFTGETIIHSTEAMGRVVEHALDSKWNRRIHSIYRLIK